VKARVVKDPNVRGGWLLNPCPPNAPSPIPYSGPGTESWTEGGLVDCRIEAGREPRARPVQDVDASLVLPAGLRGVLQDLASAGNPLITESYSSNGDLYNTGMSSPVLAALRYPAFYDPDCDGRGQKRSFAVHHKKAAPTKSLVHVGLERAYSNGVFQDAQTYTSQMAARRTPALRALADGRGEELGQWRFQVRWRACVGVSSPSPWEAGLAIHPLFGVPVLPATALVSAARRGAELAGVLPVEIEEVLGSEEKSRPIVVVDALPECTDAGTGVFLEADVITPHFKEAGPDTAMHPIPITFLTVAHPTVFIVEAVGTKLRLDKFEKWLALHLDEWGIGAKTSAGYGRMKPPAGD